MRQITALYEDLEERLRRREAFYPARQEPDWSAFQESLGAVTTELWTAASAEPPRRPSRAVEHLAEQPVFVVGYYKSGTSLLLNLLDGHPDILALPGESRHFSGSAPLAGLVDPLSRVKELHALWIRNMITPYGIPPRWLLGRPAEDEPDPYDAFGRDLVAFARQRGGDDLLAAAAEALATATDRTARYWAEKTPTHELEVEQILEAYPAARFVHIVRDPHSTIESITSYESERPIVGVLTGAAELGRSFGAARRWQSDLGERYTVIRYEALVTDTRRVMTAVADALDIAFDDCLLVPTTLGMPATANAGRPERRVSGAVHALSLGRGPGLRRRDRLVIEALAGRPGTDLGYPGDDPSRAAAIAARTLLFARYRLRRS